MIKNLPFYLFFLLVITSCVSNINVSDNFQNVTGSDIIKKSVLNKEFKLSLIIKDYTNKKTLEKVKISISDTTGLNIKIESNKDGKAEIILTNPSKILISYSYDGYQTFVSFESPENNISTKEILLKPIYSIIKN